MQNMWDIGNRITGSLTFMHLHMHVHRDLKPSIGTPAFLVDQSTDDLVLYCHESRLWQLTDFGISSTATSQHARPTLHSRGTNGYWAPELLTDTPKITNRADIWSLGCIFHELVTFQIAFGDDWRE